ncbi:hypothetical protein ACOME3_008828 [Neoechinorhynchus agilis]
MQATCEADCKVHVSIGGNARWEIQCETNARTRAFAEDGICSKHFILGQFAKKTKFAMVTKAFYGKGAVVETKEFWEAFNAKKAEHCKKIKEGIDK